MVSTPSGGPSTASTRATRRCSPPRSEPTARPRRTTDRSSRGTPTSPSGCCWPTSSGAAPVPSSTQTGNFFLGHFRAYAKAANDPFWMDTVGALQTIIDTMQSQYSPLGYLPAYLDEGKPALDGKYAIAFDDKAHAGEFAGNAALAV